VARVPSPGAREGPRLCSLRPPTPAPSAAL
jgi:hypothetical protein